MVVDRLKVLSWIINFSFKSTRSSHEAPLGPIVRNRRLQEGLVIIVGHTAGKELLEETCVVVSSHIWRERVQQRHERFRQMKVSKGMIQIYNLLLAYTWLMKVYYSLWQEMSAFHTTQVFSGASGSPVFDLNGNIVAMHTQGYTLNVEEGQYSLMEFGVQFAAICEDLRRLNLLEEFFPNYSLGSNGKRMDTSSDAI